MAEQVLNQFRCDKALREECAAIYSAMGMYLNTAFRMFMERARMVGGLPFPAVLPESKKAQIEAQTVIDALRNEARDVPEMTLGEINAEIPPHHLFTRKTTYCAHNPVNRPDMHPVIIRKG